MVHIGVALVIVCFGLRYQSIDAAIMFEATSRERQERIRGLQRIASLSLENRQSALLFRDVLWLPWLLRYSIQTIHSANAAFQKYSARDLVSCRLWTALPSVCCEPRVL